jgi:hypothetical protein
MVEFEPYDGGMQVNDAIQRFRGAKILRIIEQPENKQG